ncbi:MAG: glutamate-1-semialdehyde 2,1-aminomutase [Desulfobacterota bacterium]|nr:glutamate-1-semialdehyde 2,1-aminomutase [Thermodesulfobacteriota bacterium]
MAKKSEDLFRQAQHLMPGGVNSPVRAFTAVGGEPFIVKSASGSRLRDADNNEYIDYVCSWGPLILGHAHPAVVEAICKQAGRGASYGATCELEIELARLICAAIPSVELVRFVNSGTEAAMSALRLARAFTGRDTIVKFEGCYHGHADSFLIKAGSGALTTGVPTSPGIPKACAEKTLIARYNDIDSVQRLFELRGEDIAAVIVEPVAANMGLVLPTHGFLQELRRITRANKSVLIFDEVITGFRLHYGAYQDIADVTPDLTVLGKIIGGGMPVGAYGGKKEIMALVAPSGPVYQAGTLSGNPLAMAAGIATLTALHDKKIYEKIDILCSFLCNGVQDVLKAKGFSYKMSRLGSMFSLFFTDRDVVDFDSVMTCDTKTFARFYRKLLHEGVFFPPSQFETCFISAAHSEQDIEQTVAAIKRAIA